MFFQWNSFWVEKPWYLNANSATAWWMRYCSSAALATDEKPSRLPPPLDDQRVALPVCVAPPTEKLPLEGSWLAEDGAKWPIARDEADV